MTCQLHLEVVEEFAAKNHCLTLSHYQLSHMPQQDLNPGSTERQRAVSGNALDLSAMTAGRPLKGIKMTD